MLNLVQEDLNIILSLIFAGLLLYLLVKVLIKPLYYLAKVIYKGIFGFIMLAVINFTIGSLLQFQLGLNPITAIIAGLLGLPGIALIYGIKVLLG